MTVVVGYVPTDTGFLAVTEAEREARSLDVPILIVNVLSSAGYKLPTAADDRNLDAIVAHLTSSGVQHEVRQITEDKPVADILLTIADAEKAKLIVLGRHRRSRVQKALLGSTTQNVILSAQCPVLTVPNVDD